MERKWLKWRFFEQILALRRFLGYAYTERIQKNGVLALKWGMKRKERGDFPEKKISKGMGLEARDFSEKIFLEISKFCATLVAPRAAWV